MKIGIVTYWQDKSNYGQMLQMFALQQFLRNHGHEPFLIRFKEDPVVQAHFRLSNLLKYVINFPQYFKWYLSEKKHQQKLKRYAQKESQHERYFDVFIEENITYTATVFTEDQLKKNPPEADAYICGSDQIWGGRWTYYLDFAPEDKKIIAWAPSFGGMTCWNETYERHLSALLKRFNFIGIREQSGVDVCHRLGRTDAIKVVDPTLLLDISDYDKIRKPVKADKPYAVVYILKNNMACSLEDIFRYVQGLGLEIMFINNSEQGDEYEQVFPSVGEWIDMFAKSSLVITNSFHATVFALLYERPFVTIPLVGNYSRMNNRIEELLAASNLSDRICQVAFTKISQSVDFSFFRMYHDSEKEKSINCLRPHISV